MNMQGTSRQKRILPTANNNFCEFMFRGPGRQAEGVVNDRRQDEAKSSALMVAEL